MEPCNTSLTVIVLWRGMRWGEYLARGVPSEAKGIAKVTATDVSSSTSEQEDRSRLIIKLVEDYFKQEGASIFSSKIAVGYLQVTDHDPFLSLPPSLI
jgi:hypothetical protein